MNPIEAEPYNALQGEIKGHEDWMDAFAKQGVELKVSRQTIQAHIKELEESWEAEKSKLNQNLEAVNRLSLEKRQRDHELAIKRQELGERIYSDKLKALIAEQPDFAEALRGQVKIFGETRFSGLSFENEVSNHDAISQGILHRMGMTNFGTDVVAWRSAKGHYDHVIKELCDARLKGRKLTAQDAHFRFQEIIRCLRAQETSLFK